MRFYLDTSIWLDYFEKRGTNGEKALELILRIIETDRIIIVSDLHIKELKQLNFTSEQISTIFKIAKPDNIQHVHLQKRHFNSGRLLMRQRAVPLGDAIHAIIAKENEATLVSRDYDFERLRHICKTKKPEEL